MYCETFTFEKKNTKNYRLLQTYAKNFIVPPTPPPPHRLNLILSSMRINYNVGKNIREIIAIMCVFFNYVNEFWKKFNN